MGVLAEIVLDVSAFFELVDDETLDSKFALNWLESIAASLKNATPGEIEELRAAVTKKIAEANQASNKQEAAFFESFFEAMDLNRPAT